MHAGFASLPPLTRMPSTIATGSPTGARLQMPLLAVGGEKSFGEMMATVMRSGAYAVQGAIITASGHWIMEENPQATVAAVRSFLAG